MLGESLFFGLLGAARGAISHARGTTGGGLPPVPHLGNPEHLHRAWYQHTRVPTSFSLETDGRGRQYMQGYDQYGNPI